MLCSIVRLLHLKKNIEKGSRYTFNGLWLLLPSINHVIKFIHFGRLVVAYDIQNRTGIWCLPICVCQFEFQLSLFLFTIIEIKCSTLRCLRLFPFYERHSQILSIKSYSLVAGELKMCDVCFKIHHSLCTFRSIISKCVKQ